MLMLMCSVLSWKRRHFYRVHGRYLYLKFVFVSFEPSVAMEYEKRESKPCVLIQTQTTVYNLLKRIYTFNDFKIKQDTDSRMHCNLSLLHARAIAA